MEIGIIRLGFATLVVTLLLILVFFSVEIRADAACQNLARNDIQTLWLGAQKDCRTIDQVSKSAGLLVKEAKGRFKGQCLEDYISTLAHEFQTVLQHCEYVCRMAGKSVGEVYAEIFCATSEEIGRTARFEGLRNEPNMICGESYEINCESAFVNHAEKTCPKYAKGTEFENYYRASSNGCCSYNSSTQ